MGLTKAGRNSEVVVISSGRNREIFMYFYIDDIYNTKYFTRTFLMAISTTLTGNIIQTTLFIPTLDTTTKFVMMTI